MAVPNPQLYLEGTKTAVSDIDLGSIISGNASASWEWDLWNDDASAEDMTEVAIGMLESDDGGTTWQQTGLAAVERWLECQAYGVVDPATVGIQNQSSGYTPIGVSSRLHLFAIPGNTARKLRFRVNVPVGLNAATDKKIRIRIIYQQPSYALATGLFESGRQGVLSHYQDKSRSLLIAGGTLTQTGTPDGNVQVTDTTSWLYLGEPRVKYAHAIAIAASTAGKARWVTISAGDSSTFTLTESTEVTTPAPVADRPAVPGGEVLVGYVHRGDSTILNADIYPSPSTSEPDVKFGYFSLSTSGLIATIGPGYALSGNYLIPRDQNQSVDLIASETNRLYLLPTGTWESVASGSAPSHPRAVALWEVTTDGSGETARRDLRRFLHGDGIDLRFYFDGAPSASDERQSIITNEGGAFVHLPRALTLACDDMGDRTTGSLVVDLEYYDEVGDAWTSLFSASAERPSLAFNADPLVTHVALPDTTTIPGDAKIRARIATLPTGGTSGPNNVSVAMPLEVAVV